MLIPALDLINGEVVRLQQGDFERQTTFASDPLPLAQAYAAAGAEWLHVVDLDGARDPAKRQIATLQRLAEALPMALQVGGGIRQQTDLDELFQCGVQRAVIGSLAVQNPQLVSSWFDDYGSDAIVLSLDVSIAEDGQAFVATHGWQQTSELTLQQVIERFLPAGLRHVLCTDISRDGMLGGYNTELYQQLKTQYPELVIQASGGAAKLEDLRQLRAINCDSAILGKALLTGQFTLEEALACWQNA
ncbi:1-(5-phosphoribosyl)-5-[(5-phosphoribosylamino)methylideneamino]imidazole-4-carboxamide isomerase [Pseudidiomarina sp. 1APR75-15]|uniref:1-(5-phosphoribosyl)-5-[(5-phosphoribosylamino)methylideneamino] imidazole-4-carboxamide isomerase n=1 Tax=Pseudidiomarina terrestris TaxID=2820060 RepID=A0ABT8MFZ6_9GAMM|nr:MULTISPECIES: 1-(5-phosphoribosyl)-5-[(5-phosphoribosylamino)methylideneamino]imidazole-4-carboxamide isomerase [unclassified Pseudidiomarina]MDN7127757.1 1-(5-phosphoribosyl)-5-[(5-phosphoribosylamino)methylideneamino]imidazole-4-carboxamide isomerase [Pseudidiomarina sp. 1APR75-33.1]MDN7128864.1 1-(5-phosphoribosyl)-5-[(5-phosphoribosylamino)methylideneamino]imidazole-4-carboxamide isomerase [Pseudidiomarina sp. 1APR75-15]